MSREITDLLPLVAEKALLFLRKCREEHIHVHITSTYRSFDEQDALYAQGRTKPGGKVTNAKGGQSYHNYRLAFDVVPIVNNVAVWDNEKLWVALGEIGISIGLEWGGSWKSFKDKPHFQYTQGLTLADLQSGAQLT